MNVTTHPTSRSGALALGATALGRSRLLAALVTAMLLAGVPGLIHGTAAAAAGGPAVDLPVGHTVKRIVVPGAAEGERRKAAVHLWYPSDSQALPDRPELVYTSALHGRPLVPERWDPLSWTVDAEIARKDAAIAPNGPAFPVIVFSHGSVNDPIDYAHTLERIAGAGFVVAAPYHVNNTQDDVRIDFINARAGVQLFKCSDGRPSPCARTNVPFSMADRVSDISKVLDELPGWLGDRVDVSRVGVLGHSRGTVTALAAAGGSAEWSADANCQPVGADNRCWPLESEPRIDALMGMAIAVERITRGAGLANVKVPALLVAGTGDMLSAHAISDFAFGQIKSTEKTFVSIDDAVHRHFDSTYCAQTQAAGAIAQKAANEAAGAIPQAEPRAILDLHTVTGTVSPTTPSGRAIDYCPPSTFTTPTNITTLVASLIGFNVTANNVPTTGLDSDDVKQRVTELAVEFFGKVLKRVGTDGPRNR